MFLQRQWTAGRLALAAHELGRPVDGARMLEIGAGHGFFLDAADMFFDKGHTALGVRVLGNLAEMDLENRHILRILGYRLMHAVQPKLAVPLSTSVGTVSCLSAATGSAESPASSES